MSHLPEEVVESIIDKLTSNRDRNSASLVNRFWYTVDRYSRRAVYVSNCYALSPHRLIARFPMLRSLTLKGKPRISDSSLLPNDWGGSVHPWVEAMSNNCPSLEKLRLKRMLVSDGTLHLISISFPNFKSLILSCCCDFTIAGLSAIASNCSILEQLEVERSDVTDNSGQWLSSFPETQSSLVSLNISCIKGAVNPTELERLVARCPNLTTLALNKTVPADTISRILLKAPQLMHLGVGSNMQHLEMQSYIQLSLSFRKSQSIQSLAFFNLIPPMLLRAIHPICPNLVDVNMRYAAALGIHSSKLINFLKSCPNLQRLWIQDCIGDEGLEVVSYSCKNLQDLRVFHGAGSRVSDKGLSAISVGCQRRLKSLTYFCSRMTNAALISFSNNCPNITCFRLCIWSPQQADHMTLEALDQGFGAIVQSCKKLRKLTLSGLLTDQVFLYTGMYAERLEVLCVSNAGESDAGMHYVFNGCKNLRKVEIRNCPFGDIFLEYGSCMRSLWMSSCKTTLGGCKMIAQRTPSLNVEIINETLEEYPDDDTRVDKLYMYQTLDGPRADTPTHIWTL